MKSKYGKERHENLNILNQKDSSDNTIHIIVIDNTIRSRYNEDSKNNKNKEQDGTKFLNLLVRFLRSAHSNRGYRRYGRHRICVDVVRTVQEYQVALKKGANRVIMSGSSKSLKDVKENSRQTKLAKLAIENSHRVPVLGICFGAQMINAYYDGTLMEMKDVMCVPRHVKWITSDDSYHHNTKNRNDSSTSHQQQQHPPSIHSYQFCLKYMLEKLGDDLIGKALLCDTNEMCESKQFVAFSHKNNDLHGVLFHPEAIMDDVLKKKVVGREVLQQFIMNGKLN